MQEAIELYFETLPIEERQLLLSREIPIPDYRRGSECLNYPDGPLPKLNVRSSTQDLIIFRSKGSYRIYGKRSLRVMVSFHGNAVLHPKIIKQVVEIIRSNPRHPFRELGPLWQKSPPCFKYRYQFFPIMS